MGEREMMLVLAAMLFFSMTSLSVNRFCLDNNDILMESENYYQAISLAQMIIEEAKTRAFDVAVESGPATNPPYDFTYPLGPRWDEHYPNFTDVDDYNNLNMTVNTARGSYNISVYVGYVTESNLKTTVGYKTFYKRMTVRVYNNFMPEDVILSHVFAYYEF